MGRYRAEWGNDGRLWGTFQPSCVFNGLVDGFAEILILFGGSIVANIAAVLVVVGFGYAAAFQELFRPEFPALSRPDGTGDGKHHVTDAKVLFRAHDDLPFGGFQVLAAGLHGSWVALLHASDVGDDASGDSLQTLHQHVEEYRFEAPDTEIPVTLLLPFLI